MEKENSLMDNVCLICLQIYKDENQNCDFEYLKRCQNVFNKLSNYLSSEIFESCFQWNFEEEGSSPVCKNCYSSMEKIFELSEVVDKVQKQIQEIVNVFTIEVLGHHNKLRDVFTIECDSANDNTSEETAKQTSIIYEPDENIEIKDECDNEVAPVALGSPDGSDDDNDDNDRNSDVESNALDSDAESVDDDTNESETRSTTNSENDSVDKNNTTVIEAPNCDVPNSNRHSSIILKPFSIILTRLQLNSDGNIATIPEELARESSRPQRKAALAATASLKKISNDESKEFKRNSSKTQETNLITSRRKTILRARNIYGDSDWLSDSEFESDESGSDGNSKNSDSSDREKGVRIYKAKSTHANTARTTRNFIMSKRFKCQFKSCNLSFNFTKELKSHSLKSGHNNDKIFKCPTNKCAKKIFSRKDIKNHLNFHHIYKCTKCLKDFRRKYDLLSHQYVSHSEKGFKCEICDQAFIRKLSLEHHKKLHITGQYFSCKKCSAKFIWKLSLNEHIRVEHQNKKYKCKICRKVFTSRLNITRHRLTHFKSKIKETFPCAACKKIHFIENIWDKCIIKHFRKRKQTGFICAICSSSLKTSLELDAHSEEMNHQNKKLFQCIICKKRFYKSINLKDHRKTHTNSIETSGGDAFECHICFKKFGQKSYLKSHIERHNNPDQFKCDDCGKSYKYISDLRDHERIHGNHKRYKCKVCKEGFFRRHELRTHSNRCPGVKSSSEPKTFECVYCDSIFSSETKLKFHRKTHNSKGKVSCKICKKIFLKAKYMKRHMRTHSNTEFKCSKCELSFNMKEKLERHEISAHTEERPFACSKCDSRFKSKAVLNSHVIGRHLKTPCLCDICGKKFTDSNHLRVHKRLHTGDKLKCTYDTCERKFFDRATLKEHVKVVHTKELKYSCDICQTIYTTKQGLDKHLRIHNRNTDEDKRDKDRFKCTYCDKMFVHLKLHVQKVHLEKNIKCDFCAKYFSCQKILQIHIRKTHGEKTFQCEFCPYMCRQQPHLNLHIRTQHTKERPYICHVCGKTFARKNNMDIHIKTMHDKIKNIEMEASGTETESE